MSIMANLEGQVQNLPKQLNHMKMKDVKKICCIGATRIDVYSTLVMASHWKEKQFCIVDDEQTISCWQNDDVPWFEPDLEPLLVQRKGVNVHFRSDIRNAISEARVIFVAVDVETKEVGLGKDRRLNFTKWRNAMDMILTTAREPKFIVEKTSFPLDAPGRIGLLSAHAVSNPMVNAHHVFSNPDFFSLGTAIQDLQNPIQVIIAPRTENADIALLFELYERWVPGDRIVTNISAQSAELGKITCNVISAMNTITMNFFSLLCDKYGADIAEVERIVGHEKRISQKRFRHDAGVGGQGLLRDVKYSEYLASTHDIEHAAKRFKSSSRFAFDSAFFEPAFESAKILFKSILSLNKRFKEIFVEELLDSISGLEDAKIALMGFSCRENTSDIKDTPALYIAERLFREGTSIRIHDPKVPIPLIQSRLPTKMRTSERIRIVGEHERADTWKEADAICFLQKWEDFNSIDLLEAYQAMNKPAFFFDACNMYPDLDHLRDLGFVVHARGRLNS